MDVWKKYEGKNVFLVTRSKRQYSGKVINVNDSEPYLIWITIIDKFSKQITFVHSEISFIEEEK